VSALEAMQGVQATFTLDEVYNYLRSFEETLKQAGESMHGSKVIALPINNHTSEEFHDANWVKIKIFGPINI
jgi:hypothetical protein